MSFKIEGGLFEFDFTDHHAVLGVPVDADFKEIRKRYVQIARRLHPDTCSAKSEADKQLANQLLSKLVNPAYKKFSLERDRAEYMVTLREMSKRLSQEAATIQLKSELAKQLNQSNNIDGAYKTALAQLARQQYTSLEQVLSLIAQISELNLVYLMREGSVPIVPSLPLDQVINPEPNIEPPPAEPEVSGVEPYFRRAQILMETNNFTGARVELQDALKLEPNNSRCHSLIGMVYLKQNQITMAKVHINKALQLNSGDAIALEGKQKLDQLSQGGSQSTNLSKDTKSQQSAQNKNGGFFGGLFGGKKK